jgi:ring-1,2-phenylacetyl-CoA epoxidase subunit PaaD
MEAHMNEEQIWQALQTITDPEIPVVTIVELGIVRQVDVRPEDVTVTIAPTFAGCPALHVIQQDIRSRLTELGATNVQVKTQLAPAWTSDWITEEARAKLKAFGLAPPVRHGGNMNVMLLEIATCPRCGSRNTRLQNSFGTTLCRSIYTCKACHETFEQFKAI